MDTLIFYIFIFYRAFDKVTLAVIFQKSGTSNEKYRFIRNYTA